MEMLSANERAHWDLEQPEAGSRIGEGVSLFHDGEAAPITVRERRPGVQISTDHFDGAYLSLAFDLRKEICARLRPGWRLVVSVSAELSRPLTTFLRLNLSYPHDSETLHELVVLDQGERSVVFDLDRLRGVPDVAWLDVLFHHPSNVEIRLADLSVTFDED